MRALSRSLVLVAVSATLLAGCADSDGEPKEPAAQDSPATSAPAGTPTNPATPAAPESTAPTTPAGPATLAERLLSTAEVPGLNASWHWQDGETGPAPAGPFGVCARASLADIGATEAVQRTYFPPDDSDDNAGQQVAEFPDAKTTALAWSVLKSWHDKCGAQAASHPDLAVRPLQPLTTSAGEGRWYLLSWVPADDETGRFETIGMVRAGTRITVLRMTHSGPDHNYPAGRDPMVAMTRTAAGKLG